MKVGDRVKVIAPGSCFQGKEGTVRELRDTLLPIGVKIDTTSKGQQNNRVWFDPKELEPIAAAPMQLGGRTEG